MSDLELLVKNADKEKVRGMYRIILAIQSALEAVPRSRYLILEKDANARSKGFGWKFSGTKLPYIMKRVYASEKYFNF